MLLSGCMNRSDSLAPIISIYEPKSGTIRTVDNLRVFGYAMDDEGIAAIRVNGTNLLSDPSYEAERRKRFIEFGFQPLDVTEGENNNIIEVEDTSGRRAMLEFTLSIDTTPPTLEITTNQALDAERVRVAGVARDNNTVTSVRINGEPLQFTPAGEVLFELVVPRIDGGSVVVEDSAGNVTRRPLQ
jgi:hypothetical protein